MIWIILQGQMASPQWDYDYPDLIKYLEVSKTSLANFDKKYPDLSFKHVHSWPISSAIIKSVIDKFDAKHLEETAYLEPDEVTNAATIGARYNFQDDRKWARVEKKYAKAQETFANRLYDLIAKNDVFIRTILFEMEQITAEFTRNRLDKRQWHLEWVAKQEVYLANYFIKQCKKFSPTKNLPLVFVDNIEEIPSEPGLYFLFQDGKLRYIGHSGNLKERIGNHSLVREYYSKDDAGMYNIQCVFATTLTKESAAELEREILPIAKPPDNVKGIDL